MNLFYFTDKTGLKGIWLENNIKINYAHPFSDNALNQDNV